MNKQNSHNASEVSEEHDQTVSQPNGKMPFVEPIVSTPEDVLEATTFFGPPTVDAAST